MQREIRFGAAVMNSNPEFRGTVGLFLASVAEWEGDVVLLVSVSETAVVIGVSDATSLELDE